MRRATVFYSSPVPMCVTRLSDGRILDVNDAAVRLIGYSRDEALQQTTVGLEIWPSGEDRAAMAERIRESGRLDRLPVRLQTRDGESLLVELSAHALELHGEQCLIATMVDVTERARLTEIHLQAQKMESLGTLAGGIAHDFNNILAAIRGHAELAGTEADDPGAVSESLREIEKASARAADLVRRLLGFAHPQDSQRKPVNLELVLDEVLRLLRPTLPAQIRLQTTISPEAPHVFADASQIHEALVNLTTNAVYAIGPNPGVIEYRLESVALDAKQARLIHGLKAGRYSRLSVSDSGVGMEPGTLERVFDAFFTTKPLSEGTGLGLSMVHGTMTNHHGAITVDSAPGAGSRFHLWFPASDQRAIAVAPAPAPATATAPVMHVMYVDDEAALINLAKRVLTNAGHRVSGFTEARDAIAAFHANPADVDILVTDLSMPQMTGFDVARDVLARRPDLPVVLTTGYARDEEEQTAREIGIREVLRKPVSFSALSRDLVRIVEGTASGEARPAQGAAAGF